MKKVPQILGGTTLPAGRSCRHPTNEAGASCFVLNKAWTFATPLPQPRSSLVEAGQVTVPSVTISESSLLPCSAKAPTASFDQLDRLPERHIAFVGDVRFPHRLAVSRERHPSVRNVPAAAAPTQRMSATRCRLPVHRARVPGKKLNSGKVQPVGNGRTDPRHKRIRPAPAPPKACCSARAVGKFVESVLPVTKTLPKGSKAMPEAKSAPLPPRKVE